MSANVSGAIPQRLGPYEILSPLGAGGMGEVYRARDTRLGREVAIKILRGDVATDPDRKARFEREARTVASLNHPNIVALFEVGNADGVEYTVSELVEGQSLRSLLQQGPIAPRRAVEIATQMAEGLAAAHAAGIVHRDLKPENVMLTRDGRVKLLDFGLARISAAQVFVSSGNSSAETQVAQPTFLAPGDGHGQHMTTPGMVLGTAAYMSPEQARGLETDYRSDQFSFGLIVYEMLTGKQAFSGASMVDVMAAIVRDDPAPLDTKVPVTLRWVVDRCLEKDPAQRFDSTRDLYQQLRMLRDHYSEAFSSSSTMLPAVSGEVAATSAKTRGAGWPFVLGVAAIALLLGAAIAYWLMPKGVDLASYHFTPIAGDVSALSRSAWSPDGNSIAYVEIQGDSSEIYLRNLNSTSQQLLAREPRGVQVLGWSSDRGHILYLASGDLRNSFAEFAPAIMSVAVVGGEPEKLMDLNNIATYCGALSPDGKTLALYQRRPEGLDVWISSPIGSPLQRYPSDMPRTRGLLGRSNMRFSPDGKNLLLVRTNDQSQWEGVLLAYPANSGTAQRVLPELKVSADAAMVDWMPDSKHVVMTFDKSSSNTRGVYMGDIGSSAEKTLIIGVLVKNWPTVSPDGQRLLFTDVQMDSDIISVSLEDGAVTPVFATARKEDDAYWSHGSPAMVYITDRNGSDEIWLHTLDGDDRPIVTQKDFPDQLAARPYNPVLSPDGKRVIYQIRSGAGNIRLFESSVSGGAPVKVIEGLNATIEGAGDWSPDGRLFAALTGEPGNQVDLRVVRTTGNARGDVLIHNHVANSPPAWSPDGNWITYSDKTGWHLISPDGKQSKDLGPINARALTFSHDSKYIYGVEDTGTKAQIFQLDLASMQRKNIKDLDQSLLPRSTFTPGHRVTVTPDGKALTYAIRHQNNSLWMLEGFPQK